MPKSHPMNPSDAPRHDLRPFRGQLWALVVLVASLTLVVVLWQSAYQRELQASEAIFASETRDIADLIQQRMVNFELVSGGGISLFASVARPTPDQWLGYVDAMELPRRFPSVAGLGFTGYLRQSRLEELQNEWQQAGWGALKVRPQLGHERLAVVLYLEPKTRVNQEVIGFDMYSEPVRKKAMEAAMDSGEPKLSAPVALVQGESGHGSATGLLLYRPVYRGNEEPVTVQERRDAILGWVYVPFWVDAFIEEVVGSSAARFRLDDVTDGSPQPLSHRGDAAADAAFTNVVEFDNYGRRWRMTFDSAPLATAAPGLRGLQNILALGLFASLLMYAIAWMLARTESRAQSIARRLTEEYRHSEERFRTAMEYSAIGKALLDHNGCIVQTNGAFGTIVGVAPVHLEGRRFDELFEAEVHGKSAHSPPHTADGDGIRRETRRLHREGGEPRHVQLTYAPMPGGAGMDDVVGLVQVEDVTARIRAEARVRALNRTLEARVALRTRELSHANHELEAFAYSVSHDLRAPLRAIDGFSRVLVERYGEALDDSGRDYLGRVRKAAGRMGELIEALLKMSRVSRGDFKTERVDLSRMAEEIIEDLRAGDPERSAAVKTVVGPGLSAEGDTALLRNLLGNLLGNAWKFTRNREQALIEFGQTDGTFFVRDNGAGFPQDYVHKLFRPFQRLHAQADFDGHGVGLASAKRVVERHGGVISAEGQEEGGATFRFTLVGNEDDAD